MPHTIHSLSRRSFLKMAGIGTAGLLVGCNSAPRIATSDPPAGTTTSANERWASSTNLNITLHSSTGPNQVLTRSGNDFKPSWSPDGTRLTFFRAEKYGADFKDWRSKICVINADGSGLRELTTTEFPNFNPTWTRDGSNCILFNRFSPNGDSRNQVHWTSPDASPGEEQLISDPGSMYFEWVNSGLRDGRIFVDRVDADGAFKSFLLTPLPGKPGEYVEIERPTDLYWHKLSLSPSETKVAYMLDNDNNIPTYDDDVICYSEFDVKALKIQRQVTITTKDLRNIQEYPAWNKDESLIVYDSNEAGTYQVYVYRLADGVTARLSPDKTRNDQFAAFEGVPK
jgi:hypothetical protein